MESGMYSGRDTQHHPVCKAIAQFHHQAKKLSEMHGHLKAFNHSFASLLLSIQMQADCVSFDKVAPVTRPEDSAVQNSVPEAIDAISPKKVPAALPETQDRPQILEKKKKVTAETKVPPVQDKRKKLLSAAMKRVAANVPLAMREAHHLSEIELLVGVLVDRPEGEYLNVIYAKCPLDKHRTMQWLNLLVRTGDIVKESRKGLLYRLNPEKYVL